MIKSKQVMFTNGIMNRILHVALVQVYLKHVYVHVVGLKGERRVARGKYHIYVPVLSTESASNVD